MAETVPVPSSAPATARAGMVLAGRYRLESHVASGGMAQVWRAVDLVLERPVAVKVLHPHLAHDPALLQRFRTEAVAAARVGHPGIVAVYDTCSEQGLETIVMEFVGGRTLRAWIDEQGPLTPLRTAEVGARVGYALEAAHRAGLVHRDVKPANLLLCDDGRVMVTDFGIAKLRDATDVTQAGTLLGTAKYLAPEQVEGGTVDSRTDVYALGIVLYEAVVGRPPFVGDNQTATALARLHADPTPPSRLRNDVPPSLEAVILRCLERDPDRRWQTAHALARALDDVGTRDDAALLDALSASGPVTTLPVSQPNPVTPPRPGAADAVPPSRRWMVPAVALGVVAVALAVLAVVLGGTPAGHTVLQALDPAAEPIAPTSVSTFDPEGTGRPGEMDAQLGFLTDGDLETTWRTENYGSRDFGGRKSGVGVVVELSERQPIEALEAISATTGWGAAVYVADSPTASLAEWGDPVAELDDIGGDATFDLGGQKGRFVLLWITDLGDAPPSLHVEIAELVALG